MPPTPARKLAVVTCMDARVNVERILGLEPRATRHVIRNAGALVTDDVLRSLELYASLGTEEVVVLLHTDCGARATATSTAAARAGGGASIGRHGARGDRLRRGRRTSSADAT